VGEVPRWPTTLDEGDRGGIWSSEVDREEEGREKNRGAKRYRISNSARYGAEDLHIDRWQNCLARGWAWNSAKFPGSNNSIKDVRLSARPH
jgi:hypothetical protein